jgi:ATP-binding cassette subfamily C protein CydD
MEPLRTASDKNSLRWLIKSARPAHLWVLLSVGLGMTGGLLLVAQAGLLANIIQGVFIDRLPRNLLTPLFIGSAGVVVMRAVLAWGREAAGFQAGARVREETRRALIQHIFDRGPAYTELQRTGGLASTLLEQVEALQDFFAFYLPQLALAVMIPVAILAFVLPLSWAAGLLLALSAPLIPLFMILVGMGAESISQRNFQALSRLSAHFLDVLQGLATLKLFDRSRAERTRVAKFSADYRRQTMRVLRVAFLSSAVLEFFSSMGIALVAVYLGMHYLGYLSFGDYGRPLTLAGGFFILLLAPDFYLPLRELGTHYHARAAAIGASGEILKVLSDTALRSSAGTVRLPPTNAVGVSYQSVHFAYDAGRLPVLKGVDFELAAGAHVALVGASGAGKTTLLNLLMGFVVPTAGSIRINGIVLETLAPEHWRRHLAWIGQNPVLFHGTIRENILLGRPAAVAAELESAARAARVLEFCHHLPAGLDTPVGEKGFGLSRGQAQRVALARAFLKDAPLLLLDEPTAGLDTENEQLVLTALDDLSRGRTVLTITHRLENLRRADHIVVLESGRIVEKGIYKELLASGGAFYRLATQGAGEMADD